MPIGNTPVSPVGGAETPATGATEGEAEANPSVEADLLLETLPLLRTPSIKVAPFACAREKTPRELITSFVQDVVGVTATPEALAKAAVPGFSYDAFVDEILADPEARGSGVARFATNLFRLVNGITIAANASAEAQRLAADLRQEPVLLIQKRFEKPWRELFTTRDIYCTTATAKLYNFPLFDVEGFVACRLPQERAGLLGLASVLRSISSSFYSSNNNYHRAAFVVYLTRGILIQAATAGPTGVGRRLPLAACVAKSDRRVASGGLVFGTAAIPLVGATCAGCHSRYLAPLSVAFRRFAPDGTILDGAALDKLSDADRHGAGVELLKEILAEDESCWTPQDGASPMEFHGQPGLGRVIAASDATLGTALGQLIAQNLLNRNADENFTTSVAAAYFAGSGTLRAAFHGAFTSASYKCATPVE